MTLRIVPFPKTGRTGLERIGLGTDGGRLVYGFQKLLYICRFYDLKFEVCRGKIHFSRADGSPLEPVNGDYICDFRNINDLYKVCEDMVNNRAIFDAREFDPQNWKWDLDNSFFNEI